MRKIFILGGSSLQLDLILEAKKMFFYTIVLDYDENCIGAKWCDEFLHIDIADKELVLQKAQEYNIYVILTSATELGNLTACFVGEKLGLNTNSYQTALNTTNKLLMKNIMVQNSILTAQYEAIEDDNYSWEQFPCIVKPSDSSASRGVSYCQTQDDIKQSIQEAKKYCKNQQILIEDYIEGIQYSIETISSNNNHQIVAINSETIHDLPTILEVSHQIPAVIDKKTKELIKKFIPKVLKAFNIKYGASHIEVRITKDYEIYMIEIASRIGGWRSEMINFAYGVNYSQLLILASMGKQSTLRFSRYDKVVCNFIVDYNSYKTYLDLKQNNNYILFEPFKIENVNKDFKATHTGEIKGYYYILEVLK